MLQVPYVQKYWEIVVAGLKKRGIKNIESQLQELLTLNAQRKTIQQGLEEVLHESNLLTKQIGQLFKEGRQQEANSAKTRSAELKQKSKDMNEHLHQISEKLKEALYHIPNVPHVSVPEGQNDGDNEVIKNGDISIPTLPETAKPHWDLIKDYNLIDFELGVKITGAGFPVYKAKGAKLVRGLINYFLDKANEEGYMEVQPPSIINEESGKGTGNLPDKEGQMYHITDSDMYLIPTAEVPITNMYRDVIISEKDLPIKHCGYTPCFRREAGSWGAHVRGLNRLHQFDKVEIVQVVKPKNSYQVLDEMVSYVETLIKSLGLPYRILRLCGGDIGFTSALTYDFEVYSVAQKKWLEVSSVSNFETYQANRLKLRYKNANGKKELAHTLNGSALALPRIIAAILENNQRTECIKIPEVLISYLGFSEIKM